jgi:hypothetical protein
VFLFLVDKFVCMIVMDNCTFNGITSCLDTSHVIDCNLSGKDHQT